MNSSCLNNNINNNDTMLSYSLQNYDNSMFFKKNLPDGLVKAVVEDDTYVEYDVVDVDRGGRDFMFDDGNVVVGGSGVLDGFVDV